MPERKKGQGNRSMNFMIRNSALYYYSLVRCIITVFRATRELIKIGQKRRTQNTCISACISD